MLSGRRRSLWAGERNPEAASILAWSCYGPILSKIDQLVIFGILCRRTVSPAWQVSGLANALTVALTPNKITALNRSAEK